MKPKPSQQQTSQQVGLDIVHPSYQPRGVELSEDLCESVTLHEALIALVHPAAVRCVKSPKRRLLTDCSAYGVTTYDRVNHSST